jgi:hypothetical protein
MSQILRDRYGYKIGEIRAEGTKYRLLDRYGYLLGWYEARVDMTFNKYGLMIGRGDLLTTLLSEGQ